ncbi:MAG: DUF5117 domain-containing protein [Longimicrobiales bacterium]|nr:DUF5117 domain-containing protein [Longimicrobiales bacterium]
MRPRRLGAKLLFEIPRAQLGKDQLLVTEIAKTVLGSGYGGQSVGNRVMRWELTDHRVHLRAVSYEAVADPDAPEYAAVQAANVSPIVVTMNVEAYGPAAAPWARPLRCDAEQQPVQHHRHELELPPAPGRAHEGPPL